MAYNGIIVGLGQIGMEYDYHASSADLITTHAHALDVHPGFDLVGGVDIDENKKIRFSQKYKKPAYSKLSVALQELKPDLTVISVPTEFHLQILEEIVNTHIPKIVIIEKPLSHSIIETERILEISTLYNLPIAVNYYREYEPALRKVSNNISEGLLGYPLKIILNYNKGLFNNASHFLNYIFNFSGEIKELKIIQNKGTFNERDIELDVLIKCDKSEIYALAYNNDSFYFNELEIVGPKGKLLLSKSGELIEFWSVIDDPVFKGYRVLSKQQKEYRPNIKRYQFYVYENIINFLNGNNALYCDVSSLCGITQFIKLINEEINNEIL